MKRLQFYYALIALLLFALSPLQTTVEAQSCNLVFNCPSCHCPDYLRDIGLCPELFPYYGDCQSCGVNLGMDTIDQWSCTKHSNSCAGAPPSCFVVHGTVYGWCDEVYKNKFVVLCCNQS